MIVDLTKRSGMDQGGCAQTTSLTLGGSSLGLEPHLDNYLPLLP